MNRASSIAPQMSNITSQKEGNVNRKSIIGVTGASVLDVSEGVTTRLDNLDVAVDMERTGKDPLKIRLATGWEKGVDGKWRYEIEDALILGEVESRNVSARLRLTPEERRSRLLADTEDVARNEQIILSSSKEELMQNIVTPELAEAMKDEQLLIESGHATISENGLARLSIATYEQGGRQTLEKYVDKLIKKGDLTEEDARSILQETDNCYKIAKKISDSSAYASFTLWSDAVVEVDEEGKPYFGVVRKNGEYVYNIDFSTVCKKRRPLDTVFNALCERGVFDDIGIMELTAEQFNVK